MNMEARINVAEILKDKPQGTKLYSILSDGDCFLNEVSEDSIYIDIDNRKRFWCFTVYGSTHSFPNGCVLLFPSREMRDWEKFSWKKGDVLVTENGAAHIIFEKFTDDTYTIFAGKCYYCKNGAKGYTYLRFSDNAITEEFTLETEDAAKTYISFIEKRLGGKLNRETLEIEKAQPEFKDGDIVTMHKKNCDIVFIFNRLRTEDSFYYYAFHTLQTNNTGVIDCHITLPCAWTFFEGKMNFATDSEKQQLFDALAKEGKAWDAKKKQIVDLKQKVEFKPFDKVVVRDKEDLVWFADLFSHIDKENNRFACVGNFWNVCLPYNVETAKLIGTTNNVEG